MKITTDDIAYVAALANLEVPEGETETLAEQLSRIVEYVEKLNQLETDDIEPTTQVVRAEVHHLREDRVQPREGSADTGAPARFFNVPRVISDK